MKKKLPKKLYVKWHDAGDGELYLAAAEEAEMLAEEVSETINVGVYELVDTGQVVTQPTFWLKGAKANK